MIRRTLLALGLTALPLFAWWAYAPGLGGGFLFDDFNNLSQLGEFGGVHDLRSLALYLSSGNADPTGRPLALLSFLIDANNWPADPESFKRTNILLHLLNGLLLAWVLLELGRKLGLEEARAQAAALLGSALWTLHPLFVSTTLYVVQREAMLPAGFTLLACLLWLAGRQRFMHRQRGGLALLLAASCLCTALATLCKANGMLLPLLLLVMEWTLLQERDTLPNDPARVRRFMRIRRWLLVLPSVLLAAWLLSRLPSAFSGNAGTRPWSVAQRLITEPRVLCNYLGLLWIPRASAASIFNDGFRASTDLLHPWTTLPALALIAALLTAGFRLRRCQPALAFAILFYFAGQVLESTLIPLELYFEHRNYLPALPMFWPLALWLTDAGSLRRLRWAVAALLPVVLVMLCNARVGIWGRPFDQALLLAQVDTDSARAQTNAAQYLAAVGRPDLAADRLRLALKAMPDEAQLAVNLVDTECATGAVSRAAIESAEYALSNNHEQAELVQHWLVGAIGAAAQGTCKGLDFQTASELIAAMRRNPHYSRGAGHQHDIWDIEGRLALAQGNGTAALRAFDSGMALFPTPDGALLQAALLGAAGFPALGLQHLQYYKSLQPADRGFRGMAAVHAWLLQRQGYWTEEFERMEDLLRADAAPAKHGDSQKPESDTKAPAS